MTEISIQLPDEVLSSFHCTPKDFVQKMQLAAAIYWYQQGDISQEKAAQIAGINPQEFLTHLAQEKPAVSPVEPHELQAESSASQKKEFIRSLRGKYANSLTPTHIFSQQKQAEIDWEERNQ